MVTNHSRYCVLSVYSVSCTLMITFKTPKCICLHLGQLIEQQQQQLKIREILGKLWKVLGLVLIQGENRAPVLFTYVPCGL